MLNVAGVAGLAADKVGWDMVLGNVCEGPAVKSRGGGCDKNACLLLNQAVAAYPT